MHLLREVSIHVIFFLHMDLKELLTLLFSIDAAGQRFHLFLFHTS